jgi:hypothetical protein
MWIDDYVRLLFPITGSEIRIQEAMDLKYQNMPTTFYKYRTTSEKNLKNLEQGVEWQSYPIEFNDPYDASFKVSIDAIKREMFTDRLVKKMSDYITLTDEQKNDIANADNPISMFIKIGLNQDPSLKDRTQDELEMIAVAFDKAIHNEVDQMIEKFTNIASSGYLVSCFSEEKSNRLMWSHYSDNHRGYCVGYNLKDQGLGNPIIRILHPTIYSNVRFDATEYYKNIVMTGNQNFNNLYGMFPAISKDSDWTYEKEWRTVNPLYGPGIAVSDAEKRLLPMPKPAGIYLGARIAETDKCKILVIAQRKEIPVYQMILSREGFELNEENIYNP